MFVAGTAQTEALRNHLKWFLFLRVIVITAFLGAFAAMQFAAGDLDDGAGLLYTIAATYAFSIASALTLKRTQRLAEFTYVQLEADVLLITGAVLVTGGGNSPFPFLYSLVILNAAILLSTNGAAVAAIAPPPPTRCSWPVVLSVPELEELTGAPTPTIDVNLVARLLIENAPSPSSPISPRADAEAARCRTPARRRTHTQSIASHACNRRWRRTSAAV
jgi:hypothetical protein